MPIFELIARVLRIILYLLARFEHVNFRLQHFFDVLKLSPYFLLSVTDDPIAPLGLIPLPQSYRVDRVYGNCEKDETRKVHVSDLFKSARMPQINRLRPNLDQEEVVEYVLDLLLYWNAISTHRLPLNVPFYIFVMGKELGVSGFVCRFFGILSFSIKVLLFKIVQIWVIFVQKLSQAA